MLQSRCMDMLATAGLLKGITPVELAEFIRYERVYDVVRAFGGSREQAIALMYRRVDEVQL
jgi:hypothetical protein